MRIEQVIAAVARRLAIAEVRVITVVDQFALALRLHLSMLRTHLGMPSYPGSDRWSRCDFSGGNPGTSGCKRGKTWLQPRLATVGCLTGSDLG